MSIAVDASASHHVPMVAPGFLDPVHGAQVGFRTALDALANPGVIHRIDVELPDVGIPIAALAVLLSLVDADTPLWTSASVNESMRAYLRFHAGARFSASQSACAFAYVGTLEELPLISSFSPGSAMSPEDSTTIIVAVDEFVGGATASLDGPGCREPREISPAGFTVGLWEQLADNHARFPAGVDLLIVAGRHIVGLPRSTRVCPTTFGQEG